MPAPGAGVEIRELGRDEVGRVWSIDRREVIERMFRHRGGALVLEAAHHDVRGWPAGEPEEYGPLLRACVDHGGAVLGAFADGALVGAVALEGRFRGPGGDRLQLPFLHVSHAWRGRGLGRRLFGTAVEQARARGARGLYVSATPSERTVRFYLRLGCRVAEEVDPVLFAREPEDIHLDFEIPARPGAPGPSREL